MALFVRAALALTLTCCSCNWLDVGEPIALAPGGEWPPLKVEALAAAADCWNQRFGTQISLPRSADHPQQVVVDFDSAICPFAAAATTAWPPRAVYICPDRIEIDLGRLFDILVHEMGHVLNIDEHAPANSGSVMEARHPSGSLPSFFSETDVALFYAANDHFDRPPPCKRVRLPENFIGVQRCTCDDSP